MRNFKRKIQQKKVYFLKRFFELFLKIFQIETKIEFLFSIFLFLKILKEKKLSYLFFYYLNGIKKFFLNAIQKIL